MSVRKFGLGLGVFATALSLSGLAPAQVLQTDAAMTPLPQPVGEAEFNLVTNAWAFNTATQVNRDETGMDVNQQQLFYDDFFPTFENGDAITLNGLFKYRGETDLDYQKDARTAPGYFSPVCGFQGQILLRGGGCEVGLGWYNVEDPNSTTPPAANEIYPLVPQDTSAELDCQPPIDKEFCPLAWDNHNPRELNKAYWTPKVYDSGLISEDPNYKGKYVGFAMIGNPSSNCSATKYSMYEHNTQNASGVPWVTSIIYQSRVDPEGFYLAFEDLPMSTADWKVTGVPGNMGTNDGDFNDFVFYISGIGCSGGGMPCDTGLSGACALGRTDCAIEGETGMCRPAVNPGPEKCDNVDNDCNGVVDDGAALCGEGLACEQGMCVSACSTGEFQCPTGLMCSDEGNCVDPLCTGVTCDLGLACRGGNCVSPCDGVVCPGGQECQLGRCVDPCAAITCPGNKVCEKGLCVSKCDCRGCPEGLTCETDGRCVDTLCAGVMCDPGLTCQLGACVDLCDGVVCPNGGVCVAGNCQDANTGGAGGGSGGGIVITGGSTGMGTGASSNGSGATGSGQGSPGSRREVGDPGCACRTTRSTGGAAGLVLAAFGAASFVRRRRTRSSLSN
jgi:MYXO-CTERM domain-containing protein